jgi:hypothetical protein
LQRYFGRIGRLNEDAMTQNDVLDPAAANAYFEGAVAAVAALQKAFRDNED